VKPVAGGERDNPEAPDKANDNGAEAQPKRSAIVTSKPKRKHAQLLTHLPNDDETEAENRQRGDAAGALWRELVRRVRETRG